MAKINLNNETEYFDVLKEVGNIGAGNASTALGQMLGKRVDVNVPMVRLLDWNQGGYGCSTGKTP